MKIEKFRELLELYFLDELDQEKRELIENKILESDEYKREFDSYQKFYSVIQNSKPKTNLNFLSPCPRCSLWLILSSRLKSSVLICVNLCLKSCQRAVNFKEMDISFISFCAVFWAAAWVYYRE